MRTVGIAAVAMAALVSGAAVYGPRVIGAGPAPAVKWGPAPPFFPAGARFAVVQGDPSGSGVYTVRLEMPAGYVIKPHWHPTDEHITVLSGRFLVGMGDSVDTKQTMALGQDGFATAPAQAHHFAVAARKTVVQVHGMGPFAITYVRPSDDPRGTTASQ
jgi:quercetin dioxygenase-like cupin family protein